MIISGTYVLAVYLSQYFTDAKYYSVYKLLEEPVEDNILINCEHKDFKQVELLDLYFKTLYLEFIKIFYFNVYFCHSLNFKALDMVLKGKSKHSFLDIFFLLRIFLNSSHSLLILISVFSKKLSTEVNKLII